MPLLNNCLHCDGKAECIDPEFYGISVFYVKCLSCGIATEYCHTKKDAAKIWNRRADTKEKNSNSGPSGQPTGDKSEPADIKPCDHVWGYFHAANEDRCIKCGEV